MASISATYPGGGYRTDVSGGGGGFQAGGGEDMGWLMDLARRRAEQKTRQGQYDLIAQREMLKQATRPNVPLATAQSAYGTPMEQRVAQERGLADIAQSQAISRGAPQEMVNIGGWAGYMPDVRKMTGAQRQVFTPQQAAFTGEPTPLDIERGTAAGFRGAQTGEQEGIRQMLALLAGSQPGFGGAGSLR